MAAPWLLHGTAGGTQLLLCVPACKQIQRTNHCFTCRLDPSSSQHGAYVDDEGVFHCQHIDAAAGTSTSLLRFQLQFRAAEWLPYEPISKPWAFEFVPGAPGDLLLVQEGSCRILYASLPKQGTDSSDVFLFGSHTGKFCTVRSIRTRGLGS